MFSNEMLLFIALIMYSIGIAIALYFDMRWLFFILAVLWFVPIMIIDNIFIITFSVVMIVSNALLAVRKGESDI